MGSYDVGGHQMTVRTKGDRKDRNWAIRKPLRRLLKVWKAFPKYPAGGIFRTAAMAEGGAFSATPPPCQRYNFIVVV